MINYVLVDDEPRNNRILRTMLEEFCPDTCCCGVASTASDGEALVRNATPDLLFLDIQLANENAFDVLDRLLPLKCEVIFVTAFHDYTLKAFRYSALDYLLKPVNIQELRTAVAKAAERLQSRNINQQLQNLIANLRTQEPAAHRLALSNGDSITFIIISDIIRCEADGGYTIFHMKNGDKLLSTKTIKEYEELLPSDIFFRVHHSHIVNLLYVNKYYKGRGGYVELDGKVAIEVSTRRKSEFLSRFGL